MSLKVLEWRLRAGNKTIGKGDSFREAVCDGLNGFSSVSESDLDIEVRIIKRGNSFWHTVNENHIERIFEKLEDREAREKWDNEGVARLL